MTDDRITTPTKLMLARALGGVDVHDSSHDDQLLADARITAQCVLTDADIRLNEMEDRGWVAPEDVVDYAARLLLLCPDLDKLVSAIRTAQAIYVVRDRFPGVA